jgi:hypothetical protein
MRHGRKRHPVKTKLTAALSGAALIVTMGSLAGCGDGNEKLRSWAKSVCDSASVQVKKINAANTAISQVDSGGNPADIEKADAAAFQEISDAYKALGVIVGRAGDPPVEKGGAALRTGSVNDLNQLSEAYADLKKQIDALDTKDQGKFADGLQAVSDNLGKVSTSGERALDMLRKGEVGRAMAEQPGCRNAGAGSPSATASA